MSKDNSDIKAMMSKIRSGEISVEKVIEQQKEEQVPPATKEDLPPDTIIGKEKEKKKPQAAKKKKSTDVPSGIIEQIKSFDSSNNDFVLHNRVNEITFKRANGLKAATKIDTTRLVAFAIDYLFENNPELDQTIKNYFKS